MVQQPSSESQGDPNDREGDMTARGTFYFFRF